MRSNVRRALVTGAARGVGHATSLLLADRGYEVVGVDIRAQRSNGATATISADLSDPSECDRVIAEAGRIDVLVNAHGLLEPRAIESTTVEDFDRAVSVNLRSVFLLCQGSAPSMAAEGWGRIINFSSVVARTGGFSSAPYAAAKAGVIALTKSFATAYSGRGVTCNAVAPAAVDTELNAFLDEAGRQRIIDQVPVGRFSTPEEFAALVLYLAGDDAGYITGATIDMNGGWVMT
ncbi:MAG: SDR family NAD(P)-dependent oxidoreductase [bacterium]|nr:SDR family NAD(P)-dependent oxidoreductase [bacterium]